MTGELSVGGGPTRGFIQTFVLAPEAAKKYYVHNDMFRYLDKDLTKSAANESAGEKYLCEFVVVQCSST